MTMTAPSRYDIGPAKLNEIDGQAGAIVVNSRKDIAPDLTRWLIEFPFGRCTPAFRRRSIACSPPKRCLPHCPVLTPRDEKRY